MENPTNSVSSRLHGLSPANPQPPKYIGSFKYHLTFDSMNDAWDLVPIILKNDGNAIITTNSRPNMMLRYTPNLPYSLEWVEWKYYEYAEVECGYYGTNYYLFGSGKVFRTLPDMAE